MLKSVSCATQRDRIGRARKAAQRGKQSSAIIVRQTAKRPIQRHGKRLQRKSNIRAKEKAARSGLISGFLCAYIIAFRQIGAWLRYGERKNRRILALCAARQALQSLQASLQTVAVRLVSSCIRCLSLAYSAFNAATAALIVFVSSLITVKTFRFDAL